MQKISMGIDIGGSHITCRLFDLTSGKLIENPVRIEVDGNGSKDEILQSWANAIRQTTSEENLYTLAGIGFAMPGPFDYLNGIAWFDKNVGKFQELYGTAVKRELIRLLELPADFRLRFFNDAACFAVGVANTKPASEYRRVIALTLGTGFGSSFLTEGIPVTAGNDVPENGFLYNIPFQDSIADEYFSTRWFVKEFESRTGNTVSGVVELAESAYRNPEIAELFKIFGVNLGKFLAPWVTKFGAKCIVVGGNIARSRQLFERFLTKQFAEKNIKAEIVFSESDEHAALIGSARLCDDEFYKKLVI